MKQTQNFTEGKIFAPLIRFALPVLLALFLQTMYGAVDLLVVGQFGTSADVSAVSTGSLVMTENTEICFLSRSAYRYNPARKAISAPVD